MSSIECPHCGNKMGFVFGRCCVCGFNHQTHQFETIKVSVDDLPRDLRDHLVQHHAYFTKNRCRH